MRAALTKTISTNSKELNDVVCIPTWTKHHALMDDPLEGVPIDNFDIFKAHQKKMIDKCFHLIVRNVIVVKLKSQNGVWYETDYENLHALRRKWTAEKASPFSNKQQGK